MSEDALVTIRNVSKSFGGVKALQDVSFDIAKGEIHALCGENGAGKSTLNNVLAGSCLPDAGTVTLDGRKLPHGNVVAAEAAGVMIVHQESAAFATMNAEDNVFAGHEPRLAGGLLLDKAKMRRLTRDLLTMLGETFSTRTKMEDLSVAQRQMVGIARALSRPCSLLVLDEPTASLSSRETERLFTIVRQLREQGVSILYVSHRLDEVFELADRVTVLRDGKYVGTVRVAETNRTELIKMMVGREVEAHESGACNPGDVALEVENLNLAGEFHNVSLSVRAGEVVTLAGLVGAGRSQVVRAVFGIEPADSGKIAVCGRTARIAGPQDAIRRGIALVPEDRQHEGLALPMKVSENLSMAVLGDLCRFGTVSAKREEALCSRLMESLAVKAERPSVAVETLSGGNQQKVLLGKWLAGAPKVLILDEPTRGVDVGAKAEVHRLIRQLADSGVAVLVISSDLPEVLAVSDRILVMREGTISGELARTEATQEKVLGLALPEGGKTDKKTVDKPASTKTKDISPLAILASRREYGVGAILLLMVIVVSAVNSAFLTSQNIRDMLMTLAPTAIVACGMTLVIITKEIDISVGSLTGLAAAVVGIMASPDRLGYPVWLSIAAVLSVGLAIGLVNGALVAFGRVPSIIVTLGMLTALRGLTDMLMGGKWIQKLPDGLRFLGKGDCLSIPISVWVAIATVALTAVLLSNTALGRRVYAVGNSPRAASLAGISPAKVRLFVFALTGFLTAVAMLVNQTRLSTIESGAGTGFEMVVITCVVVGGTSIRGGRGSVLGSVLGVLLLGTVGTVLIFLRLGDKSTYWEPAIQGAFILAAVLVDHVSRRKAVAR